MSARPVIRGCGKRCYSSTIAAKRAMATAHNRVRVYFCRLCLAYHVSDREGDRA